MTEVEFYETAGEILEFVQEFIFELVPYVIGVYAIVVAIYVGKRIIDRFLY